MKVTYDQDADAMYIYLAPKESHKVAQTETYQKVKVELNEEDQIVGLLLFESDQLALRHRLKYASQQSEIVYNELGQYLYLTFTSLPQVRRTVEWDANVDIDHKRQIVGIEILFGGELTGGGKVAAIREHLILPDDPYFK